MSNPQTLAAAWHWVAAAVVAAAAAAFYADHDRTAGLLLGAAVAVEAVGVHGHYRLRKSYARWHECQPRMA